MVKGMETRYDGSNNIYVFDKIEALFATLTTLTSTTINTTDLNVSGEALIGQVVASAGNIVVTFGNTIEWGASKNWQFSTGGGTKIGTNANQKIAFWDSTPVVQQVLATGTGATVDNVITFLQTLGLCKQS